VTGRHAPLSHLQRPPAGGAPGGGCSSPSPRRHHRPRAAWLGGVRPHALPVLMEQRAFDVVTGAFSFTGRFIARRLAVLERPIKTLTNHPQRAGAQEIQQDIKAQVAPLQFTDRPALVFGQGDILINNIAWLLRRLPAFGIPGRGDYRLQPVAGEDVAEIATWAAEQVDSVTVDAAGPDIIYYSEMVESIAIAVGRH